MNAEEVKATLKAAVNHLIKDEPSEADKALHDVLAAKMKARLNPAPEVDDSAEVETDTVDTDTVDTDEVEETQPEVTS